MEKIYDPKVIEKRWIDFWDQQQLAQPPDKGTSYCIMLPPPNVTGTLHMGHAFQQTLMDALIRYHRMRGFKTLWQGGTDHAGIATQIVVEQQLAKEGQSRQTLGREKFIERVWQWREQSGHIITQQMRRLGLTIDWSRERFSLDEGLSQATSEAFLRLYADGLIYQGQKLVNWDPILKTAISDLEVTTEEMPGHLWYIRYPLEHEKEYIIVATTRPETLLGDVAVAVHPEDERYRRWIGQRVRLPFTSRLIPVIADDAVDPHFGTGCVKITPAHDFNDYAIAERHRLPAITILTPGAHLNESVPTPFRGLTSQQARQKIVVELEKIHLLEKVEPYRLSVPRGERSNAIIEPRLTEQWFIKMQPLAQPAMAVIQHNQLKWIPEKWVKTYLQWLENIQDWCISRQLWWGHRLPVWYDDSHTPHVGRNEADVRARYKLNPNTPLVQETDVLDTWFSASLWPFATLGWPKKTVSFKTFYPTQVLVTGFDIIFFWVARMVMMSLKLTGQIPFETVYITGLIRDNQGKKMSKSKGNIIDPIDLIDGIDVMTLINKRTQTLLQPKAAELIANTTQKEFPTGFASYGTDALRFTFCALASTGRDIHFDTGRIEGYRHFCNKLWNAARYVMIHTTEKDLNPEKPLEYSLPDNWIRSQLQETIIAATQAFASYRFDVLAKTLYEFVWNEYCDWYLELSKCILLDQHATAAQLRGTRLTLLEILETVLRLIHPIMPFITEEIWQSIARLLGKTGKTILLEPYPMPQFEEKDKAADAEMHWLKRIIITLRTLRSEINISPAQRIPLLLYKGDDKDPSRVSHHKRFIQALAKVDAIQWPAVSELPEATAADVLDQLEIHIPLKGLINPTIELTRLGKEIHKLRKQQEKSAQKLANSSYVNKAPPEIVQQERFHLSQIEQTLKKLLQHYHAIERLGRGSP
ncbi:MAG: valine--tRNA ligase [Coxiella sp. RIFCSPHIGHO2_12_FULL_44_14]|nr:MAG: valine--tRNA ligase [Coxiella sp. RIFCSPHIGHO2_12_FULL_44_14]